MNYHWETFRRRDGFTLPGAEASYAPDLALEPRHIEVRMRFEIEKARAEGVVTTTVRANRAGASEIRFDAVALEDLEAHSATDGRELSWRYDGEGLHVHWHEPFERGEERRVAVRYRVDDPVDGMRFSRPDEAYPDRPLFVATDHETERARHWLPCVDYPNVRTSFDFHLTAREDLTILANGALRSEESNGDGTKTAHWRLEHPCPSYLCCMAAGDFVRHDDEPVDGRPVAYFTTKRFAPEDLARSFGPTPAMMRWLEGRLGVPFPFPKYFQLALPHIGGAMENISLVTWDEVFVTDERLREEWGWLVDAVNIHEMAHSYFGDHVVCRHFEHSWLKESWAVYVETVYWEENASRDEADYDLWRNAQQYIDEADNRYVRPIVTRTYNASWDLFDRHLYPGGAWRIHMLRHRCGEEPFWAAVRDYLRTYGGRVVETDDFRRKLEEHSGLNLTRFFDQWILSPGYPKLEASWSHDSKKGEGTLTIKQTQKDDKKGVGLFAFPLEIAWEDGDGRHRAELEIEEERHSILLGCKGDVKEIQIDPELKALFSLQFKPGDDLLKSQLTGSERIAGRIRAAMALIDTGKRKNLRAVADAMAKEPFWGVREAVAKALGDSLSVEAIEPLVAMLDREEDPRPMAEIARAAAKMRDPRLREALLRFLDRDPPPWARSHALAALGAQRDDGDLERLVAEGERESIHDTARMGALRGLAALRTEEAAAILRKGLAYGAEPEILRAAVPPALAACARFLERPVREAVVDEMIDATRDPQHRMRMRSALALSALGAPRAVPALRALRARHAAQDHSAIDRMIQRLRADTPGDAAAKLQKRIEELESSHRKLDERVQDLEAKEKS